MIPLHDYDYDYDYITLLYPKHKRGLNISYVITVNLYHRET